MLLIRAPHASYQRSSGRSHPRYIMPVPRAGRPARALLPQARVVRGQVGEGRVLDRGHDGLDGLELDVPGIALIRLEQQHLLPQEAGRLAHEARDALVDIALALLAVADDA